MRFCVYNFMKRISHCGQDKRISAYKMTTLFPVHKLRRAIAEFKHRKNGTLITELPFKIVVIFINGTELTHKLIPFVSQHFFALIFRICLLIGGSKVSVCLYKLTDSLFDLIPRQHNRLLIISYTFVYFNALSVVRLPITAFGYGIGTATDTVSVFEESNVFFFSFLL